MVRSEYDRQYYFTHRETKLARQSVYSKTEIGREVNRRASKKYGANGTRAEVSRRYYESLKLDSKKYAEHLQMKRAQNKVHYALKTNKIVKGVCEVCGNTNVHAHHDNYTKPLNVRWLCKLHHGVTRRIDYGIENVGWGSMGIRAY